MTTTRSSRATIPRPETVPDGFGPPPRPRPARNLAAILLGTILVLFCAVGVAAFTASLGHRRSVLVVVRAVSAGAVVQSGDLGEARLVPDPALRPVAAGDRSRVVGRVAGVNLIPGTLLAEGQLASGPQVDASHAVVGLSLKAGEFPTGLQPLEMAMVVETSPASSPGPTDAVVLVDKAEVISAAPAADGQTTIVSVMVPRTVAPSVAGAAAHDQVSLVLVGSTPGGSTPGGSTTGGSTPGGQG